MTLRSFNILKDRHKGKVAVIMGAAPSLFPELALIAPYVRRPVIISINDKPARWFNSDYIVFIDANTAPLVEGLHGEKVSPFEEVSNYHVEHHVWCGAISATLATYLACYAGCDQVILVGFDLYTGEREYFDDRNGESFRSTASGHPTEWHLNEWRKAFQECPRPEVIRAVGGPLVDVFGRLDIDCR